MAAAEARAESPAPAPPPLPVPEKRAAPENGGEVDEARPGTKRRRAFVATLEDVPCAAAAEDGHRGGSSFSFQHARGGFVALETTPKFGSFNPPAAAERQEALDPKPAPPAAEGSPALHEEEDAESPRGVGDREDENSHVVTAAGSPPGRQNEPDGGLLGVLVGDS